MSRKIDPETGVEPNKIPDVSRRKDASRPPHDWPGIPGRSPEHEGEFVHHGAPEEPAEVTEEQRRLEREFHRGEKREEPGE
ncbi:MAG: hypothetical protein WBV82_25100 [Myxococcaceae bacterium]